MYPTLNLPKRKQRRKRFKSRPSIKKLTQRVESTFRKHIQKFDDTRVTQANKLSNILKRIE